jgi:hypothetical protein
LIGLHIDKLHNRIITQKQKIVNSISHHALQEDEEEGKRTDIVKAVARSTRQTQKQEEEPVDRKSVSSDTQTQKEPDSEEKPVSQEGPSEEHTEPELSRLMQQTDDAKVTNYDLYFYILIFKYSFLNILNSLLNLRKISLNILKS